MGKKHCRHTAAFKSVSRWQRQKAPKQSTTNPLDPIFMPNRPEPEDDIPRKTAPRQALSMARASIFNPQEPTQKT